MSSILSKQNLTFDYSAFAALCRLTHTGVYGRIYAKQIVFRRGFAVCRTQTKKVKQMKYIKQFGIIIAVSFIGEVLKYFIPLPIPASIYGLVLMYILLLSGAIKPGSVKETAYFLIEIMPLMFIPAAAGLIETWGIIKPNLLAYAVITVFSTFLVMLISGRVTQLVIKRGKKGGKDNGTV